MGPWQRWRRSQASECNDASGARQDDARIPDANERVHCAIGAPALDDERASRVTPSSLLQIARKAELVRRTHSLSVQASGASHTRASQLPRLRSSSRDSERRGRDSNPRDRLRPAGFQDWRSTGRSWLCVSVSAVGAKAWASSWASRAVDALSDPDFSRSRSRSQPLIQIALQPAARPLPGSSARPPNRRLGSSREVRRK